MCVKDVGPTAVLTYVHALGLQSGSEFGIMTREEPTGWWVVWGTFIQFLLESRSHRRALQKILANHPPSLFLRDPD